MFKELARKLVNEQLNKPVYFGLSFTTYTCTFCDKKFDTFRGARIHIGKKHKNGRN